MTLATCTILCGDALEVLRGLPAESVQCCVTSPPYWGLRDYGVEPTDWPEVSFAPMPGLPPVAVPAQRVALGLETDPWSYIGHLVLVFRELRRVLRDDGVLWLNLGDCYASTGGAGWQGKHGARASRSHRQRNLKKATATNASGLKEKDLAGVPWRSAFSLQADGWWLRSDCVWAKPNPVPESVTDRPAKAHEYVFLLAKSRRYSYDASAVRSPLAGKTPSTHGGSRRPSGDDTGLVKSHRFCRDTPQRRPALNEDGTPSGANLRSVWELAPARSDSSHSSTFPPALAERCILAGSRPGDTVLDPFGGSGTTGLVANRLGRNAVLIEIKPAYAALSAGRIRNDAPLLAQVNA